LQGSVSRLSLGSILGLKRRLFARLQYDGSGMKARVRLKLLQAEMRARPRSQKTRCEPNGLKRRIAATVLAFERGWSPVDIAHVFGWDPELVKAWFEAAKPLL
jgi:hypothetical protein